MEQERRTSKQDEQAEVEGHRISLGPDGQVAGAEERVAFEPAERIYARSGEAEDGPEVEGHRYYVGPSEARFDPPKE